MNSLSKLQDTLGYQYQNPQLLETALIHRSYLNEDHSIKQSNERSEFLGDAVLELITSEFLFTQFPDSQEGELTSLRAKMVQTKTLAALANELELGSYLKMSKGEKASGGATNASLLADTVEAIIGSIYLDNGIQQAKTFINKFLLDRYEQIIKTVEVEDWKSRLQELVQAQGGLAPTYQVINEEGPDHDRIFTIQVYYFDKPQEIGTGKSKQTAQQAAARKALEKLQSIQ